MAMFNFRKLTLLWVGFLGIFQPGGLIFAGELDSAIDKLSKELVKAYTSKEKKSLAIVPFTEIDGEQTKLGRLLSEKLITAFHKTKRFKMLERSKIENVLEELKLGTTGLIDESTAKKIGSMLGAELLITGNYTQLAKRIELNSRLITTDTGEIQSSANVKMKMGKDLAALLLAGEKKREEEPNEAVPAPEPIYGEEAKIKNHSGPPQSQEGRIYFTYFEPEAESVHIAGDFNNWAEARSVNGEWIVEDPKWLMMKNEDGIWEFTLPNPDAGTYLYKFVINNSQWRVDPNAYEFVEGYPGNPEDETIYSVVVIEEDGSVASQKSP